MKVDVIRQLKPQEPAMFVPAPIDKKFAPYANRRVLRRNASLVIDGAAGNGRSAFGRIVPQGSPCDNKRKCDPCAENAVCDADWGSCQPKALVPGCP
jgi:hypothetical protein